MRRRNEDVVVVESRGSDGVDGVKLILFLVVIVLAGFIIVDFLSGPSGGTGTVQPVGEQVREGLREFTNTNVTSPSQPPQPPQPSIDDTSNTLPANNGGGSVGDVAKDAAESVGGAFSDAVEGVRENMNMPPCDDRTGCNERER